MPFLILWHMHHVPRQADDRTLKEKLGSVVEMKVWDRAREDVIRPQVAQTK